MAVSPIFGKYMQQLEAEVSGYLVTQAAAVSSGTAGLIFTLAALGIKPGHQVVLPSFTFMATGQAILYAGGLPLFADIDDDLNISVNDLEHLLDENSDVGAVVVVHMYGLPARAPEIEAVVERASRKYGRKIALLFDAAHAFGASIGDRRSGASVMPKFSHYRSQRLWSRLKGGLVASRNVDLLDRIRCMRNYGVLSNYNAHFPRL